MSIFLEISQLDNGDIVLREADDDVADNDVVANVSRDPIVRIRFSDEVQDMLGGELVGVAEAMIEAATDFLDNLDAASGDLEIVEEPPAAPPVIH